MSTPGTRWDSIKTADRLGAGAQGQSVDQTLTAATLAGYAPDGVTLTDAGIVAGDVLTSPGGGTGATVGGLGSPYEQIPIGAKNGVNTSFFLDYIPASPPTGTPPVVPFWLFINGSGQSPYTPRYTLAPGSNHLVMAVAPNATDEFWCVYFRGPAAALPSPVASATVTVITSYAPSSTADGYVSISFPGTPLALWDNGGGVGWTNRTSTFPLSPLPAGFGSGAWTLSISVDHSLWIDGTDVLQVYEVYADVVYADMSTARISPVAAAYSGDLSGFDPTNSNLSITHIVGDGTTATYTYSLSSGPALTVGMLVDVWNCVNAGFNVDNAVITALGSGTFSIANATVATEAASAHGWASAGTYFGEVASPNNAVDGILATSATLTRYHYYPAHSGGGINFTF